MTPKKSTVRLPLTWSILSQGWRVVTTTVDEGVVMWLGPTLSYLLLCRASELCAYADGKGHPESYLTRNSLTFLSGEERLSFENRARANAVQVRFRASKSDQKREECTITRTRAAGVALDAGRLAGAFEALQELRNVHPQLPGEAPLTVRRTPSGWNVLTRTEAVAALRLMVGSSGRDPAQYALRSGRIGGATQLAAQGISELQIQRAGRWKSRAFMTYVRAAVEGADSVSAALAK